MPIALVAQTGAGGLNGATTPSINTTGASLLVAHVACSSTASITLTDSAGNSWTLAGSYVYGATFQVSVYYCVAPTISASHTVTVSGSSSVANIRFSAWSGVASASPVDGAIVGGSSGAQTSSTVGTTSISPSQNGSLVIGGVAFFNGVSAFAGQNGFTQLAYSGFSSGNYYGLGVVYQIQTTAATVSSATAISSWTTSSNIAVAGIAFKEAGAGATATTLTGPSSGTVGSASSNFTVGANGAITGTVTVTPSDGGAGGTFTPTSVAISSGTPTATFTYTASSAGAKTISTTNDGGLTNPSSITYTASAPGSPTAGTASLSAASASAVTVTAGAASGGTSPYSYQWHRSSTANFTPGAGTAISGGTTLTYADTGAPANAVSFYRLRVTDSLSATADSNEIAGVKQAAALSLGFIGDSITAGYLLSGGQDPATQVGVILRKVYNVRDVTITNRGVPGSKSSEWLSGGSYLGPAKTAFASAGVTHVHIMLGANDAAAVNLVSAATFGSNLSAICSNLTAAGYTVLLSYPTYIPAGANTNATTAAGVELARQYQAQIDALIDGTTVLRGDTLAWQYFANNLSEYLSDKTHPTATGAISLANMWARAIDRAVVNPATTPPAGTRTVTLTLTTDGSTPAASLTGLKWAWWDEPRPDLFSAPTSKGAVESTDGSGVLTITVQSALSSGGIGWLTITNSDGTTTQSPAARAFSGPVVVA